jgi:hypothetical protein
VKAREIGLWTMLMVLVALFTSCAPPPGAVSESTYGREEIVWEDVWVETLKFTVDRDSSIHAEVVVLQSKDKFKAEEETSEGGQTMLATTERYWSRTCRFTTQPYNAAKDAYGFTASADFASENELRRSMHCLSPLAQFVEIHPLEIQDRVLWTNYEFKVGLDGEGIDLLRNLSVTLPGKTEAIDQSSSDLLTCENTSRDTVSWQISPSATSSGAPGPSLSFAAHSSRLNVERLGGAFVIIFGAGFVTRMVVALLERRKKSNNDG